MDLKKYIAVAILISDKIYFRSKLIRKDRKHYILIKRKIQQEDIVILPSMNKHKLIKEIPLHLKSQEALI